jgi:hypothetical protein
MLCGCPSVVVCPSADQVDARYRDSTGITRQESDSLLLFRNKSMIAKLLLQVAPNWTRDVLVGPRSCIPKNTLGVNHFPAIATLTPAVKSLDAMSSVPGVPDADQRNEAKPKKSPFMDRSATIRNLISEYYHRTALSVFLCINNLFMAPGIVSESDCSE